jgi:hypothetical protein
MSFARVALLPPTVRQECHELASNLGRVQAFVSKFVSMGFCDASPDASRATTASRGTTGQSDLPFMCSDMISFLFRVEKLCPSREAALYVLQSINSLPSPRSRTSQVCQILEKAGLWQGSVPFDDAVQPMLYRPHFLEKMTQERLVAVLLDAAKSFDLVACQYAVKTGCVHLCHILASSC